MNDRRTAARERAMRGAVRTEALVFAVALLIGLAAAGAFYFVGLEREAPSAEPPAAAVEARAVPAAARCVSGALPLSRAVYDLEDLRYALVGPDGATTEGLLSAAAGQAIVPFDTAGLDEGAYRLRLGAEPSPIAFVVDRTPPSIVATEPSLDTCPGDTLTVRLAATENVAACGPLACALEQDGAVASRATAVRDGGALTCTFETAALMGGGGEWRLVVRDGAGNETVRALDWPDATVTVEAPATTRPGLPVTARATALPAGGEFAVQLLSSEDGPPEISTQTTPNGSVATIRFRAPRDSQIVGLDVAYRLAGNCPIVRPAPTEIAVSTDVLGLSYEAAAPSLCGNGRLDDGEACDAGEGSAACNYDCTPARCGDGVLNPFAGEQCDGGPGCSDDCVLSCGDGVVDPGEQCDDGGESAACNLDCTVSRCGDEITNLTAGERCDDGNLIRGDGCSAQCRLEDDFEEEDPALGLGRWLGRR